MNKSIIYVIGIGNSSKHLTIEAKSILSNIKILAGHIGFIEMVKNYISPDAYFIDDTNARNKAASFVEYQHDRISAVVNEALKGNDIAVLSGGDSGIWGMAGVFLEAMKVYDSKFIVKIIPGIPTMTSIAAKLGAPLLNGFSLIAIADEDTPFDIIKRKLKGAAFGGGVIVLFKLILENIAYPQYYPKDKYPELYPPDVKTKERLNIVFDILKEYIPLDRPMAVVTDAFNQTSNYSNKSSMIGSDSGDEEIIITTFGDFINLTNSFRFFTSIIIGDENTIAFDNLLYTPQWHYKWEYKKEMLENISDIKYLKKLY